MEEDGIFKEVNVILYIFSMEWGLVRWSLVRKIEEKVED